MCGGPDAWPTSLSTNVSQVGHLSQNEKIEILFQTINVIPAMELDELRSCCF